MSDARLKRLERHFFGDQTREPASTWTPTPEQAALIRERMKARLNAQLADDGIRVFGDDLRQVSYGDYLRCLDDRELDAETRAAVNRMAAEEYPAILQPHLPADLSEFDAEDAKTIRVLHALYHGRDVAAEFPELMVPRPGEVVAPDSVAFARIDRIRREELIAMARSVHARLNALEKHFGEQPEGGDPLDGMTEAEITEHLRVKLIEWHERYKIEGPDLPDLSHLPADERQHVEEFHRLLVRTGLYRMAGLEETPPVEAPVPPPLVLQPGEVLTLDDADFFPEQEPVIVSARPTAPIQPQAPPAKAQPGFIAWQKSKLGFARWQRVPGAEHADARECSRLAGLYCDSFTELRVTLSTETPDR